jgi:hypothetical protein
VRSSGQGRVVDAAIVDIAAMLGGLAHWIQGSGQLGGAQPSAFHDSPFYDVYRCGDGGCITLGALEFGTLLSGAVLTEQVFSIPGFGKLIVDAVFNRDYAVVQGVVLVTATVYVSLNLLADVLYVLVNPRLRG